MRSQTEEHAAFGGVVPEIAARAHVDVLDGIVDRAMKEAGVGFAQLSAVAAAAGPGLIGGVIVGLTTAKAIAMVHDTPLIAVNHLEAHALTPRLTCALAFPYCLFLASGGHTQIVAVVGVGNYVRLGTTVDDAMGEAFDKVAKMLGLPYPGGPEVERAASGGDPKRFAFPRPMLGRADANFSLSGLKTAVRNEASRIDPLEPQDISDLCASFQAAVLESTADRLSVGLQTVSRTVRPAARAGRRRRRRRQPGDPRRVAGCRGESADHADHSAAGALHRQWRDDRLGRRRAAGAGPGRYHGRRPPRALAARRQRHGAGGICQYPRWILGFRHGEEIAPRAHSSPRPACGERSDRRAAIASAIRVRGTCRAHLTFGIRGGSPSPQPSPRKRGARERS